MQNQVINIRIPQKIRQLKLVTGDSVNGESGKIQAIIPDNTGTAESLVEQIKALEASLQNAREESYQAGYAEGRLRAEEESRDRYSEFTEYLTIMERQWQEALQASEKPLIELAKNMADRILQLRSAAGQDFEEAFCEKLGDVLRKMLDPVQVTLEISPELAQNIELRSRLEKRDGLPESLRVIENRSLKNGECVVKSNELWVDGKFSTQLDRLCEQMKEQIQNDV